MEYVDQRLPSTPPNNHPLRSLRRRPTASQARPRTSPDINYSFRLGLALRPQSYVRRFFLNWGERLRTRNEYLAVSQSWIGERYKVCEIVNLGRLDSVGLTKRLGGFVNG